MRPHSVSIKINMTLPLFCSSNFSFLFLFFFCFARFWFWFRAKEPKLPHKTRGCCCRSATWVIFNMKMHAKGADRTDSTAKGCQPARRLGRGAKWAGVAACIAEFELQHRVATKAAAMHCGLQTKQVPHSHLHTHTHRQAIRVCIYNNMSYCPTVHRQTVMYGRHY